MWGVELTVMLAMIGITGVFAGYEIALATVSHARLQVLVREKRRGADAALSMRGNMEASFAVVQLGMTLAGTIAAATGGAEAKETLVPVLESRLGLSSWGADVLAITILVVPLTAVMLVFGELFPKVFGLRNKEWVCLKLSPVMRSFAWGIWPAVWLLEKTVTTIRHWGESWWRPKLAGEADNAVAELQELRATAMLARTVRLIGHREEGIILGATRLASRPVERNCAAGRSHQHARRECLARPEPRCRPPRYAHALSRRRTAGGPTSHYWLCHVQRYRGPNAARPVRIDNPGHSFGLWEHGHNRIHHRFKACRPQAIGAVPGHADRSTSRWENRIPFDFDGAVDRTTSVEQS